MIQLNRIGSLMFIGIMLPLFAFASNSVCAVDSLMQNVSADSVKTDTLAVRPDSLPSVPAKHYFDVVSHSNRNKGLLVSYYKSIISADNSGETYAKAYTPWKEAFVADEDRSLELFVDGIGIIVGNLKNDTTMRRYDRIGRWRGEMMELYDIAVKDIDRLNGTIDTEKTKGGLTLAKLRAQQLRYYREFWELDSICNSSHHNVFNEENAKYWEDVMFKDSMQVKILYPLYKDIVMSDDADVDMAAVAHFSKLLYFKITDDLAYGKAYAKDNYMSDRELTVSKGEEILSATKPDDKMSNGMPRLEYYRGLMGTVMSALNESDSRFIDGDDYAGLEKHFQARIANKEGDKVWEDILNSTLARSDSSELYWQALANKYISEPSYDTALKIAERSRGKLKKYGDAIKYLKLAMEYPEFEQEEPFVKAQTCVKLVQTQEKLKVPAMERYEWLSKAIGYCPDYPEPYYYIAGLIENVNLGKANKLYKHFLFCIAYDKYEEAMEKVVKLKKSGDTKIDSRLTSDMIKKRQNYCAENFPSVNDVFMGGESVGMKKGEPFTLPLPFGKFTSIVRTSE